MQWFSWLHRLKNIPSATYYWPATGLWPSLQPRQQYFLPHLVIYYGNGDSSYIHNYGSKDALQHGYPHTLPYSTQYPDTHLFQYDLRQTRHPPLNPSFRVNITRVNPWPREGLYLACIFMIKQLLGQQPVIQENRLLSKQAAHRCKMSHFENKVYFLIYAILNLPTPQSAAIPASQTSSITTKRSLIALGAPITPPLGFMSRFIWEICQPSLGRFNPHSNYSSPSPTQRPT